MSMPLTLYGCPNSRSLRAAWALEEAGAEYDYKTVDLFRGEGRQPAYMALNPAGKVPLLITPEGPLSESGAILLWIAEHFPAAGLMPSAADAALRAQCLQWCFFVLTELEQPLWTIARHRFVLPAERRVPAIEPTAVWEFDRAARRLALGLEGREVLVGERFGIADILACHTLAWARSARVPIAPALLDAYLDRHFERPAAQRARSTEGNLPRSKDQ